MKREVDLTLAILAALFFLVFASTTAAAEYKLEKAGAPPEEMAPAVRETLASDGIRIIGPDGPLCEIWLRKSVPTRTGAAQELGIAYPQLIEGTLVGAVRFLQDAKDYRRQKVKPGVYTLRYGLHPADGNHMGVATQRDFLLLVPTVADSSPASVASNDLLALSRRAAGTNHPSVWSLEPASDETAEPKLLHKEDEDHWVLQLSVLMEAEGGTTMKRTLGLVVVGSAPEA